MSFHTRTIPGAQYSICKELPPCRSSLTKCVPTEKNTSADQYLGKKSNNFFSQISRRDVMISNLSKGKSFVQMQSENLSEIINIFSLFRSDTVLNEKKNIQVNSSARNVVYLDTMGRLSRVKHFGHQLFGYGYESPIRVHLSLGGVSEIFNFETLPLLGSTAFDSFMHSGICPAQQSEEFLNQIMKELLDLLLKAESNLNETSNKITQIETFYSGREKIHKKISSPPSSQNQHLSKRIFRRLNFLK